MPLDGRRVFFEQSLAKPNSSHRFRPGTPQRYRRGWRKTVLRSATALGFPTLQGIGPFARAKRSFGAQMREFFGLGKDSAKKCSNLQQVLRNVWSLGMNSVGLVESSVLASSMQESPVYSCKESSASAQARLSVTVPRGLHKRLKLLAHDRDMTVSALLIQLIKAEIQ
jgi:hypothetical protein